MQGVKLEGIRIDEDEARKAGVIAASVIGKPWHAGADGPDKFDCWGLVMYVRKNLFNDELPEVSRPNTRLSLPKAREEFANASKPYGWKSVEKPVHGAIALLGGGNGAPAHAGIYLALPPGPGNILHADEQFGVRYESPSTMQNRGWTRIRWFARV